MQVRPSFHMGQHLQVHLERQVHLVHLVQLVVQVHRVHLVQVAHLERQVHLVHLVHLVDLEEQEVIEVLVHQAVMPLQVLLVEMVVLLLELLTHHQQLGLLTMVLWLDLWLSLVRMQIIIYWKQKQYNLFRTRM